MRTAVNPHDLTINKFIMVRTSKKLKRCPRKYQGFQCQQASGHNGQHHFWKETALMSWKDPD